MLRSTTLALALLVLPVAAQAQRLRSYDPGPPAWQQQMEQRRMQALLEQQARQERQTQRMLQEQQRMLEQQQREQHRTYGFGRHY